MEDAVWEGMSFAGHVDLLSGGQLAVAFLHGIGHLMGEVQELVGHYAVFKGDGFAAVSSLAYGGDKGNLGEQPYTNSLASLTPPSRPKR